MKNLILVFFLIIISTVAFAENTPVRAIIPVKKSFKNLKVRAYPKKGNKADHLTHLAEASSLMAHELTHVVQGRSSSLKKIINAASSGNNALANQLFKKLVKNLGNSSTPVDINKLNQYITKEVLKKTAKEILYKARKYQSAKIRFNSFRGDLEFYQNLKNSCRRNRRRCSSELISNIENSIKDARSSTTAEEQNMNMQFLALQNSVQMESRKFQTISNASKARHDIAMASIRNVRA